MLAFGIRYLNGFAAAAEPDNLEVPEWPPHPGRVFMALAAAHFTSGADSKERAALLWMEGTERGGEVSAPFITAADAMHRAIAKHYVPVNDKAGPSKALLHSLPLTRDRQERVFARAWLEEDRVYINWSDLEPSAEHRDALARLCSKVTRIGHSSSLVHMWLAEPGEIGEPNWVPDDARPIVHLRIPGPGTLDYLEQQYNATPVEDYCTLKVEELQAEEPGGKKAAKIRLREIYGNRPPSRQRPRLSLYQGYARPAQETATVSVAQTVFSPHLLVLQLRAKQGPYKQLDLSSNLAITKRWREAILSNCNGLPEKVCRMLSGHDANGGPADSPHLAFMPLAFVGNENADGHLLGTALVFPACLSREERRDALRAIAAVRELKLGPLGVWALDPVTTTAQPSWNLRAEVWTSHPEGATHWSSVTPVVFDRHPKAKDKAQYQREAAAMIAEACTRVGLPKPRDVIVTQLSAHIGVPPSFAFPRFVRKDGTECRHAHTILVFDQPVCGPVLIGTGRYRGYGVCRAINAPD